MDRNKDKVNEERILSLVSLHIRNVLLKVHVYV